MHFRCPPLPPSILLSQVCRLFNQVIIAMASHGYLSLEGGQLMVEFIVRQCSVNPDDKALAKLASDEVSPVALRDMSSKSLQLITTTIENMDQVCVVCVSVVCVSVGCGGVVAELSLLPGCYVFRSVIALRISFSKKKHVSLGGSAFECS